MKTITRSIFALVLAAAASVALAQAYPSKTIRLGLGGPPPAAASTSMRACSRPSSRNTSASR